MLNSLINLLILKNNFSRFKEMNYFYDLEIILFFLIKSLFYFQTFAKAYPKLDTHNVFKYMEDTTKRF